MSMQIEIKDDPKLDSVYRINNMERTFYEGEVNGHKFTYITRSVAIPHNSSLIWQNEKEVPSDIRKQAVNRIAKTVTALKKRS
tara:strand:+ start:306 stop:554 length:249 start_codon:yes stop_codon:yes gene_type:complete